MNAIHKLTLLAITASGLACATVQAPPELVAARDNYGTASQGPAARLDPSSLHTAKKALDRAELAFAENPRDPYVSDAAYIAGRLMTERILDESESASFVLKVISDGRDHVSIRDAEQRERDDDCERTGN